MSLSRRLHRYFTEAFRNTRGPAALVIGLAVALVLPGCSGDEITGEDGSVETGPLTPEQQAEVVESIRQRVVSTSPPDTPLEDRDVVAEIEEISRDVLELPEVIAVRVNKRAATAQAVLQDGLSVLISNNRPVPTGSGTAAGTALTSSASPVPAAAGSAASDPPGAGRAVVTSFDGGASVAAEVRAMLADAGYEILPLGASLDDMRGYTNLGALYLDTHGATFQRIAVERKPDGGVVVSGGENTYSIQTSTSVSGRALGELEDDLDAGRVVVSIANGQAKLAITERFIAQNWSFQRGIVMLHVCFAGSEPFAPGDFNFCIGACDPDDEGVVDPTPVQAAVVGAGAQVLVSFDGYTNSTQGRSSILHFFDRVLGANEFQPEDPPQRPFDAAQVRADMDENDLLTFGLPVYVFGLPTGTDQDVNVTFHGDPSGALGAPSVESMRVTDDAAESDGELRLVGRFGSDPGEVSVGSTAATVSDWSSGSITARVPFESSGPVRVLAPDDVESNPVPLTKWEGTVTLSHDLNQGTLQAETEVDVVFRADVHRYREEIAGTPQDPQVADAYLSGASSGTVAGSGIHQEGDQTVTFFGEAPVEILSKTEIDGGGVGPVTDPAQAGGPFGGVVQVDAEAGRAELCVNHWGYVNVEVQSSGGSNTDVTVAVFPPPDLVDPTRGFLACVNLPLQDDFTIPAGSRSFTTDGGQVIQMEWTDLEAAPVPDEDTPA